MNEKTVRVGQGLYFLLGGLWPIFHMKSFEAVTGKKKDRWLVRTVGLLLSSIGAAQLFSKKTTVSKEMAIVSGASALSLATICFYYGGIRHRISRIYLLDGVIESALVAYWTKRLFQHPRMKTSV